MTKKKSDDGPLKARDIDVEYPITTADVRLMVKTLLRYQQMLQGAISAGLAIDQFTGPDEVPFGYIVHAAGELVKKHNAVTEEMLRAELQAWYAASAMPIGPHQFVEIMGAGDGNGFIHEAFHAPEMDNKRVVAEKEYAQKLLYKFLKARMLTADLSEMIQASSADTSPQRFEELLGRSYRKAQSIRFIGTELDDENDFMPEFGSETNYSPVIADPTGLPWIDQYIGGFCAGDVIGLLGPTGGGKSNMMISAAVRMAQYYAANNLNKLSVYVCYEDGNYRMKPLFWSAATHISRETFASAEFSWANLSTSEMPNDADRRLPENQNGEFILGERERYIAAQVWMRKHFKFLDFSHNIATGGRGCGGLQEIVSVVEQICEKRGMTLGFIAIDYAGLLVERHLAATGQLKSNGPDGVYLPLKTFGDQVRYSLAAPYGAVAMIAHQIAGAAANSKPFYRYLSHLDVQHCKAFAENMHACICINKEDPDTQARLINYSKIRYGAPGLQHGIIKIKTEYCSIDLVSDFYQVDEFSKKIVPKNELSSAAGRPSRPRSASGMVPGDNFSSML